MYQPSSSYKQSMQSVVLSLKTTAKYMLHIIHQGSTGLNIIQSTDDVWLKSCDRLHKCYWKHSNVALAIYIYIYMYPSYIARKCWRVAPNARYCCCGAGLRYYLIQKPRAVRVKRYWSNAPPTPKWKNPSTRSYDSPVAPSQAVLGVNTPVVFYEDLWRPQL